MFYPVSEYFCHLIKLSDVTNLVFIICHETSLITYTYTHVTPFTS